MPDKVPVRLGRVQETLFIPLAGRARESRKAAPGVARSKGRRDRGVRDFDVAGDGRGWGGGVTVLRTAIFVYHWVRRFLVENPAGTVVELGTGLNSRFERVDNGTVRWIDLDLPDTIDLRVISLPIRTGARWWRPPCSRTAGWGWSRAARRRTCSWPKASWPT